MKATLSIKNNVKVKGFDSSITEIMLETIKESDRTIIVSEDLNFKFSLKTIENVDSINIIIDENMKNVLVNYKDEELNAKRCCVTCNGYTFCGDSACCEISPGSGRWLCC